MQQGWQKNVVNEIFMFFYGNSEEDRARLQESTVGRYLNKGVLADPRNSDDFQKYRPFSLTGAFIYAPFI